MTDVFVAITFWVAVVVCLCGAIGMLWSKEMPGLASQGQTLAAGILSAVVFVITTSVMLTTPWRIRTDLVSAPTTEKIGQLLLSNYVLPFEIASVLLTAALIGALVIAREN
jgi:NADH:ubiquinone oxidoreductase subunit 6 (subunit J)